MDKPVLDATCGSRMIWFNKNNEFAVFVDKRELDDEAIWTSGDGKVTRYCNIHPDIIATSHASRLKIIHFAMLCLTHHILSKEETMPGW
mgnify:CR=1 FL=1|jgi:hypothetical protein|nr:MAG TPA: hypothetical protein [Bacteriophage sp.]